MADDLYANIKSIIFVCSSNIIRSSFVTRYKAISLYAICGCAMGDNIPDFVY